ncbi:PDZ domain-containing protein [Paenibacillus sp. IITD108]|uniref:PDZ domain-containing protein n=1 Tax=Paenibacillus sp. IITD108 TaxID=3116649 RepID=UPI002F42DD47
MNTIISWLGQFGEALLQLVTQPFYYLAILFIVLQMTRQMRLERQMFAVKLHDWKALTIKAIFAGLVIGIAASIIGIWIGAALTASALLWLWGIAAVLLLIRVRYLCFAYSSGLIAILQWGFSFTPLAEREDWLGSVVKSLTEIEAASLLLLVALLHLAEALLVRWQGSNLSTPLFLEGKRGKLVGGYMLQGFWPVPLFLVVPAASGGLTLPWDPLFSLGSGHSNWTIIAFPVMIGFTELTRSMLPEQKAKAASNKLIIYSIIIVVLAIAAWQWTPVLPVAAAAAILLHEWMVWSSQRHENARSPLYVHDSRGLRILGIVPHTPAHTMGLLPGEIIVKVNGEKVYTKEQLYAALMINPAFCKLEVLNREGEMKFAQRARYAGEHHQLGVILAPDEQATYYAQESRNLSLLGMLKSARTANRRKIFTNHSDIE